MLSPKTATVPAPARIALVHGKPRTGVWPQQVIGRPGTAYAVALAPSRGAFDRCRMVAP
jgi:hypothetical protein